MVKEKIGQRWGWGCKRRGGLLLRPLTVNRTNVSTNVWSLHFLLDRKKKKMFMAAVG